MNDLIQAFKNDYNQTCHPDVMQSLSSLGLIRNTGYGLDEISDNASNLFRKLCNTQQAQLHFIVGGTLTNLLSISAFLRRHQAVIAANSGHIEVHETGAIEACGHKILKAASTDGKLRPQQIKEICALHDNEHMVQPKLVYISQSTELGTVYTRSELEAISTVCKELNLYLFADGARLGAAMVCEQDTPNLEDMAKFCDAFYVGGTKHGALFGEALVLMHEDIKKDFRYICKQRGALFAKGWLIGAQFETLFSNNLYYDLASHANKLAKCIDEGLRELNIELLLPTQTNQIFPILPIKTAQALAEKYAFTTWSKRENDHIIRIVTSWGTTQEDVDLLLQNLKSVL